MTVKLSLKTIYAKGIAEHVHPYSFMVFKKDGKYYVRDYNGNLKFSDTDAFSIFKSIEDEALENQLIVVKNGDYLFSQKWVSAKKLRLHGEGSGTRLLPSGTFDAIDPSNLSLFNIVWRDEKNVDHDASFDPNTFEISLEKPIGTIELNKVLSDDVEGCVVVWIPKLKRIIIGVRSISADKSQIWVSDDLGISWAKVNEGTIAGDHYLSALVTRNGTIIFGGWSRSHRSTDGGKTWSVMTDLNGKRIQSLTEDRNGNIYALHPQGIYKSADQGATWTLFFDFTGIDDHTHKMVYDKWLDRIWLTSGDAYYKILKITMAGVKEAEYTINALGTTKNTAYVAIIALKKYLLFGSDAQNHLFVTKAYPDMSKWMHMGILKEEWSTDLLGNGEVFGDLIVFWGWYGFRNGFLLWSIDEAQTWSYMKVGSGDETRWVCDARDKLLVITENFLVSLSKDMLRKMKPANQQILLIDKKAYDATFNSLKASISKFNTVKVYSWSEGTDSIKPFVYPFGNEVLGLTTITHTTGEKKITDISAEAVGCQQVLLTTYASTTKRIGVLLLSNP